MSIERRGALTVKHSESDTRTESGADDRRARWRSRYSELADTPLPPAHTLLQRWVQAPQQGTALDLACGRGQDALYLARCGFDTEAWDLAEPAIAELSERAQGLCLRARVRDVLAEPPAESTFDCLHVANFLARPIFPQLVAALRPGGLLIYTTWAGSPAGRGPKDPAFRAAPGELAAAFASLTVRLYREERERVTGVWQRSLG